jgi:hypothetical protein
MHTGVTTLLKIVNEHYLEYYPQRQPPEEWINQCRETNRRMIPATGICYQVIQAIRSVVPELEYTFLHLAVRTSRGVEEHPIHCVIRHRGRFYDTYNIHGVADISKLDYAIKNDVESEVTLPDSDEQWEIADRCYRAVPFDHYTYKLISKLKELSTIQ